VNLRAKLFLFLIGLVATLLLLAAVVINRVVVGEATERLAQQLAAAEPLYRSVWETRTRLLAGATESIGGTDYVKRVLGLLYESPDPAAARETIRDMARDLLGRQLGQADVLLVADGEGRIVVADTLKVSGLSVPRQIPIAPSLHQDGRPVIRTGFQLLGKRLFQLASVPVLVHSAERGQQKVLAILATGYEVTPEVATSLAKATQGHLLIFVGSTLYASTLPAVQEPFPSPLVPASENKKSSVRKVEVAGKQYMAFVEPLRGLTGQQIGSLVLLQSLEGAVQLARAIQRWLIILGAATLLFGGLLSFVLTRAVVTPLERLDRAAAELGRGNYTYEVGVTGRDEVGRLAETFNQMRASLRATQRELVRRERLSAIGQMASSIVHDLRNPLAIVRLGVEFLRGDKAVTAQYEKELRDLSEASSRMATMIGELLEFSKGESPLERVPCPVGRIVEEALRSLRGPQADTFPVDVQGDMSLMVLADPGRMARALVNLIQNAVDAIEGKGKVEVRAQAAGPMVRLEVADNGPGIPPDIRDELFEPFVTAGKKGGTGLGLTIVKKVVERHEGRVTFQTESGVGTRFVVELPVAG
jgi:signal transduction histidine kinase